MPNKRISELTAITGANLADADLLVVVDVSDTTMASSGTNKKITMAELAKDSALTDNLVAKSTLTTDGDVLTRAAGAPARITRADLAQDSAFSSRYQPIANDIISVSAGALGNAAGSAANASFFGGNYNAWFFDSSVEEIVAGMVHIPSWWNTYHVDVVWSQETANAGDVRWVYNRCAAGDGDTATTAGSTGGNFAAPGQNVVEHTRIVTSETIGIGKPLLISISRVGNNVGDTLGNDCALLGLIYTRAT